MPKIQFKLNFHLKKVHFANRGTPPLSLELELNEVTKVQIKIVQKLNERGERSLEGGAEGFAYCQVEANVEQCAFVDNLNNGIYCPYVPVLRLPVIINGQEMIAADGHINQIFPCQFAMLPDDLGTVVKEVRYALENAVIRAFGLMRWQQAFTVPPNPIEFSIMYWFHSGENYRYVPEEVIPQRMNMTLSVRWNSDARSELDALLSTPEAREPLSHQLLVEAVELEKNGQQKTSVVMAYLALEVGVKEFIGSKQPNLVWLTENLPSPPVAKMFRNYIPIFLHFDEDQKARWGKLKPIFSRLDKLMECRNDLVHKGILSDPSKLPASYIGDVGQSLRILDVLNGNDWAKRFLADDTLASLSWTCEKDEAAKMHGASVTLSSGWDLTPFLLRK